MPAKQIGKGSQIVIALYLLPALASFVLAITADDPLGAIYLIVFALPWSMVVTFVLDRIGTNIVVLNYALMLAGIALNVLLVYMLGQWMHRRSTSRDQRE